jgi:hypothetical protein
VATVEPVEGSRNRRWCGNAKTLVGQHEAMRSTTNVSTMRMTSRWLSRTTSRSVFRSRANPTSARR